MQWAVRPGEEAGFLGDLGAESQVPGSRGAIGVRVGKAWERLRAAFPS